MGLLDIVKIKIYNDVVTGLVFTGDEFKITVAKGDNIIEIINHGTANNKKL